MFRLVAIPQVDVGALPLHLPPADGINNGGFAIPRMYVGDWRPRTQQEYSPIDLLVAGIEAQRLQLIVYDLVRFFDTYRSMMSKHMVYLSYADEAKVIRTNSVAYVEQLSFEHKGFQEVLKKNAPLTFKWGLSCVDTG